MVIRFLTPLSSFPFLPSSFFFLSGRTLGFDHTWSKDDMSQWLLTFFSPSSPFFFLLCHRESCFIAGTISNRILPLFPDHCFRLRERELRCYTQPQSAPSFPSPPSLPSFLRIFIDVLRRRKEAIVFFLLHTIKLLPPPLPF